MRSIQETDELKQTDTEITLGMRSLLGVFFGLVLICGVLLILNIRSDAAARPLRNHLHLRPPKARQKGHLRNL
jgi:hypothetical protein